MSAIPSVNWQIRKELQSERESAQARVLAAVRTRQHPPRTTEQLHHILHPEAQGRGYGLNATARILGELEAAGEIHQLGGRWLMVRRDEPAAAPVAEPHELRISVEARRARILAAIGGGVMTAREIMEATGFGITVKDDLRALSASGAIVQDEPRHWVGGRTMQTWRCAEPPAEPARDEVQIEPETEAVHDSEPTGVPVEQTGYGADAMLHEARRALLLVAGLLSMPEPPASLRRMVADAVSAALAEVDL